MLCRYCASHDHFASHNLFILHQFRMSFNEINHLKIDRCPFFLKFFKFISEIRLLLYAFVNQVLLSCNEPRAII